MLLLHSTKRRYDNSRVMMIRIHHCYMLVYKLQVMLLFSLTMIHHKAMIPSIMAEEFQIALWGDIPYEGSSTDIFDPNDPYSSKYIELRNSINAANIMFAIHAGDIKQGGTPCTDLYYNRFYDLSNSFNVPSLLTFGDNEWTDCYRTGFDPIERLQYIRKKFFNPSGINTMGGTNKNSIQLSSFEISPYIENQYFIRNGIIFTMLHVVGSNNNLYKSCPTTLNDIDPGCKDATAEFVARDEAVNQSLRTVFIIAKRKNIRVIMIVIQANFWGGTSEQCSQLQLDVSNAVSSVSSGYKNFMSTFITEVSTYTGHVAVVHGDAHFYRNCQPTIYPNVDFVMVPGASDVSWVQASIDSTRSNSIFQFQYIGRPYPPAVPIVTAPQRIPIPRPPPVVVPNTTPIIITPTVEIPTSTNMTPCKVTFKIYNGASDEYIMKIIPNRTVIDPPCTVNIESVIRCSHGRIVDQPITMILRRIVDDKLVHKRTEDMSPYFLFGNDMSDIYSGTIGKSQFHVRIKSSNETLHELLKANGNIYFRMGTCQP